MRKGEIIYFRVVAMMMVVFFHCLGFYTHGWPFEELYVPAWQFVGSLLNYIDMPAFVFISGFLYAYLKLERGKYNDDKVFLKGKTKRLLLPYIVWTAVNVALIPSSFNMQAICKGYSHLWFLMMLMMVFVIVTFTQRWWIRFSIGQFLFFMAASVLMYMAFSHKDFRWLGIQQAAQFLPYFLLGVMTVKHRLLERLSNIKKNRRVLSVLLAVVTLVIISWVNAAEHTFHGWFYLSTLLAYIAASILLIAIYGILSSGITPPLCEGSEHQHNSSIAQKVWVSLDRCSMGIYIIHHIIIFYVLQYQWMRALMVEYCTVMPFILFALFLATSWGASAVLQKTCLKMVI